MNLLFDNTPSYTQAQQHSFTVAERNAYLPPAEPPLPRCPICGEELSAEEPVYVYAGSDTVLGCPCCIHTYSAEDFL